MLYAVANDRWKPGSPLEASETRAGLYRTRREVGEVATGCRMLAVFVRYDAARGVITPSAPAGRGLPDDWSAPAIMGTTGGVTALAKIPAALVRALGASRLKVHEGQADLGRPHRLARKHPARAPGEVRAVGRGHARDK